MSQTPQHKRTASMAEVAGDTRVPVKQLISYERPHNHLIENIEKYSADLKRKQERCVNIYETHTVKMEKDAVMSPIHFDYLLKNYTDPNVFADKLNVTRIQFINRFKTLNPKCNADVLIQIANALLLIEKSNVNADYNDYFLANPSDLDDFTIQQLVRHYFLKDLPKSTLDLLNTCKIMRRCTSFINFMKILNGEKLFGDHESNITQPQVSPTVLEMDQPAASTSI